MCLDPLKFREMVFQLLFAMDLGEGEECDLVSLFMETLSVSRKQVRLAYARAKHVWELHEVLDGVIASQSREYALDRIKSVEKNVLRLALFERLIEKETNWKIILSEAYRIARKFSAKEGASFVNALLEEIDASPPPAFSLSGEQATE